MENKSEELFVLVSLGSFDFPFEEAVTYSRNEATLRKYHQDYINELGDRPLIEPWDYWWYDLEERSHCRIEKILLI